MKHVRMASLILGAVCAIGMAAATGAVGSSFLPSFLGPLTVKGLGTQTFKTNGGTLECTTVKLKSGTASFSVSLTLSVTLSYSGCKMLGVTASVSPAEYELSADGNVKILKDITVKTIGCLMRIIGNPALTFKSIKYANSGKGVNVEPTVSGIISEGTGLVCTYALESLGTYTGRWSLALAGVGTLTWDQ